MRTDVHVQTLAAGAPSSVQPRDEAVAVLAASFADEPNFVDLFPSPAARARALPRLFAGLWRDASKHGRIDLAWQADELLGIAIWFDPWAYPPSASRQARMVPALAGIVRAAPWSMSRLKTFNRRLAALHPPQPYAYLSAIGTTPARHGQGVGRQLLAVGLDRVDDAEVPAFLEAQLPATVAWYERHGFSVLDEATLLPGGATNWTMLRPAKTS